MRNRKLTGLFIFVLLAAMFVNGLFVGGAQDSSFAISSVSASTTSSKVKITKQPVSVKVGKNKTAKVTVKATGKGLKYRWYYRNAKSGAFTYTDTFSGNTYTATMNASRHGRQIYCVITDQYGNSVKTNTVTLRMSNAVYVSKQPSSVTGKNGATVKVKFTASGSGLKYQWYYRDAGKTQFTATNTFKGNTYTAKMNAARNGRQIYCVITDKNGNSIKTNTVTISLKNSVVITQQPVPMIALENEKISVTIKAKGDGLKYTWYYKDADASKFKVTNTFKGSTYSLQMNDARADRQIYCLVTDKYGNSVKTDVVKLSQMKVAKITEQPVSAVGRSGETVNVSFTATGDGLTYKWYYKDAGKTKFTATNSFKGNTYTVKMTNARNGRQIYCKVTDKYGNSVKTDTVKLIKGTPLTIVEQPAGRSGKVGKTVNVSFAAIGDGLKYQWYYKNLGGSKFYATDAFSGNTYSVKMSASRHGRQIYCVVTDKYGVSVTTNTVSLAMDASYYITVDKGIGEPEIVAVYGKTYSLATPKITGYTFQGWVDSEGNSFPSQGEINKDVKVSAVWKVDGTNTLAELIDRTNKGIRDIKITANITVNQPIYISYETNIYADGNYSLTRAADYAGDMFVVGQDKNGEAAVLNHRIARLNLGGGKKTLTIDGNSGNLKVKVVGSAIYVSDSSYVNIYNGVSIKNHKKLGNNRILACSNFASSEALPRAGGPAVLVVNGTVNMYGGSITNNECVTEAITVTTADGGSYISEDAACGGAVFSRGNFNMYGGTISDNKALRGGAIYNDKVLSLEAGTISNNIAYTYGGAISSSASANAQTFVGSEEGTDQIVIDGNSSEKAGGAIYSNTHSPIVVFGNAVFSRNHTATIGGAIYTGGGLTVRGASFVDNSSESMGGAIFHKFSNPAYSRRYLEVVDTTFTGNTAVYGGAISLGAAANEDNMGTYAEIRNCTFNGNTATDTSAVYGDGGAIYATEHTEALVTSCTFTSNTAVVNGGAIYAHGSSNITVEDATFTSNEALYGGAANVAKSGKLTVNDTVFDKNSADYGGAILANPALLTLHNAAFDANTASTSGGAVCVQGAELSISGNTTFSNNTATRYAGAIYGTNYGEQYSTIVMTGGTVEGNSAAIGGAVNLRANNVAAFDGTTFSNNVSTDTNSSNNKEIGGGAIYGHTSSQLTLKGVTMTGNISQNYGGAVMVNAGKLTVSDNSAISDSEGSTGAALYMYNCTEMSVSDTVISGNAARWNGAVYCSGGALKLTNVTANENTASKGAAFYLSAGTAELKNVVATENSVTGNGGAVYISTNVTITDSSFKKNAGTHGGAVYMEGENIQVTLTNCELSENTGTNGGAMHVASGKLTVNGGKLSSNTAAASGGAIYAYPAQISVTGTELKGNGAGYGGAVSLNGAVMTVTGDTVFENNTATTRGGAIDVTSTTVGENKVYSTLTMTGGKFDTNSAPTGGAVNAQSGCQSSFTGTEIKGNTSTSTGGAVMINGGSTTLTDVTAKENTSKNGGVIYVASGSAVLSGGTYQDNGASGSGGVIYADGQTATVTISRSIFAGNTVTGNGGAVYTNKAALNVSDSEFNENDAGAASGGAIYALVATFEVSNTTFDGNTAGYGGAVSLNGAVMTVTGDTVFENNTATTRGGAIDVTSATVGENKVYSTLTMTGGKFDTNSAPTGGAVYLRTDCQSSFNGTIFTGNESTDTNSSNSKEAGGGAIYAHTGVNVTLTDATFTNNISKNYGGAVHVNGGSLTMNNGAITGGNASTGAAIYLYNTKDVTVSGAEITGNTAKWNGPIYGNAGNMTFTGITASGNKADKGGVLYLSGGTVEVTNLTATNNEVTNNGGAMLIGGGTVTVTNLTATGNKAKYGGAMNVAGGTVTVTGGTFQNNRAIENGGAFNLETGSLTATIETPISGNTANKGGAICAAGGTHIVTATLTENSAPNAGAVYVNGENAHLTLNNCTVTNHTVTGNGGAAMVNSGKLTVSGGELSNNAAGASGGAIYANPATVEITNAQITENTAGYGGAVSLNGAIMTVTGQSTLFKENTATTRGGAIDVTNITVSGSKVYSTLTMTGGKFDTNSAPTAGAVNVQTGCQGNFTGTEFVYNSADNSAGAVMVNGSTVSLTNVTATGNTTKYGGVMHVVNGTVTLSGGVFEENEAIENGGVICIDSGSVTSTASATMNNNQANKGGAVYVGAGTHSLIIKADGNSAPNGGAVYINGDSADVTLNGSVLTKNTATTGNGGAVMVNKGKLTVTGGEMTGNKAEKASGGAIYTYKNVDVNGTKFTGNTAGYGGAVSLNGAVMTVTGDTVFEGNTATTRGGAIDVTVNSGVISTLTMTGGKFKTNSAPDGGAVNMQTGCQSSFTGTEFDGNSANNNGGAMRVINATVTLAGGTIRNNAAGVGGAFYVETSNTTAANVTISNATVSGNSTTKGDGGAIYVTASTASGATSLTLNSVTFQENKSYLKGGALSTGENCPNIKILATDCNFIDNETKFNNPSGNPGGGAIEIQNGNAYSNGDPTEDKIVFTNSNFDGNKSSGTGGAVDIRSCSYVKFDGLTAKDNESVVGWNGAVIYLTSAGSRLYLSDVGQIENNKAGKDDTFAYVANAEAYLYTTDSQDSKWVAACGGNSAIVFMSEGA